MTNPKDTFEKLLEELQSEAKLHPKDMNKDYAELTLQYFLEHERSTEDHDIWRECHMLEEMIAILNRKYHAYNPHKAWEIKMKRLIAEGNVDAYFEYCQAVDCEGRTDEEIDNSRIIMYPFIERRDLEIWAAENYLRDTWGIQRKKQATTPLEQGVQEVKDSGNPNPILTYKELQTEFEDADYDAVKQAAARGINDGLIKGDPPWHLGGIAQKYQIVSFTILEKKTRPTPASCEYQKIDHERDQ
jgi:hypothetical protein